MASWGAVLERLQDSPFEAVFSLVVGLEQDPAGANHLEIDGEGCFAEIYEMKTLRVELALEADSQGLRVQGFSENGDIDIFSPPSLRQ
jgi:hypothetical protein